MTLEDPGLKPPAGRDELADPVLSAPRARLRPRSTTSGVLLALAPLPLSILERSLSVPATALPGALPVAVIAALLFLGAGLWIPHRAALGRWLATFAALACTALAAPRLVLSPAGSLAALVAGTAALALLWNPETFRLETGAMRRRSLDDGQAQGAGLAAAGFWFATHLSGTAHSVIESLVVGSSLGIAAVLALDWSLRRRRSRSTPARILIGLSACGVAGSTLLWRDPWLLATPLALPAIGSAILIRRTRTLDPGDGAWWEPFLQHPERLLVGTFAVLSALGTVLLALPQASASDVGIGFGDAIFTSVSAVCVTGLAVLDTPIDFSPFGQGIILVLIQIGGLGIMTFSTAILLALGRRVSLRHEGAVASLISTQDRGRLFATAKRILVLTFVAETAGAALLTLAFVDHGDSWGAALWRGTFTSVSAFCNAGFALQSTSLIPYQESPLVLHVVAALIILGGLSPAAVFALPPLRPRRGPPVSAQALLCLVSAAALLGLGFAYFLAFEWSDSLAHLSWFDRVNNAWFQSATLRTAGFNSIDLEATRPATYTLMLVWMFIGGSPGGTAGGVKTTTIAVLFLSVARAVRGQWSVEVFQRRITERSRAKAAVIVTLAATTGLVAIVAILLTQKMPADMAAFEVVSALGTVGLSLGGTTRLDAIGRAIIIGCMFVGRVGGLTMLMVLGERRDVPAPRRTEEDLDVG